MYLKKIEIKGFKSFSDKVVISFDKGLNVITGPNGSGKCIVGEQKIFLFEEEIEVGRFFKKKYEEGRNVLLTTNEAEYLISSELPALPSLEERQSKLIFDKPLAIMRKKYNGIILEIIGENGSKIKVTPEHKVLSKRGWKNAKDLSIGERILSFGELKINWEKIYEIKTVKYLGEVYDIYLPQQHNYLIGKYGIVVHNSNLIDAVKFVLGENNAKLLRVDKMANLFSDSIREKETRIYGRIYLDNSDKRIPLDEKEVVISRYLDKNGESVYYVNRKRATKVTVQNLLSMAGLYVRGYNIVMQGEISRMSERTPEEIRKIIEESIGLASYDEKKAEAEEELKEAEVNLKIAMSKLEEVKNRLLQLEEEMNKKTAKKSLENIMQKLQAIMVKKEIEKKLNIKKEVEEQVKKITEEMEKIEEVYSIKKKQYDDIVSRYISEKRDNVLNEMVLKLREIDSKIAKSNNEVNELKLQESRIKQEIEKSEAYLTEKKKELHMVKEKARRLIKRMKNKKRKYDKVKEKLKLNKNELLVKQKRIAKLGTYLENNTTKEDTLSKELENYKRNAKIKEEELRENVIKVRALRKMKNKIERSIKMLNLKLKKEQKEEAKLKTRLDRKLAELREIRKIVRAKVNRIEELKKIHKNIEELKEKVEKNISLKVGELTALKKYEERARELSEIMKKAGIDSKGVVRDLISYPVELSKEVNLALEDFMEAIVIGENEDIYLVSKVLEQLGISGICLIKQASSKDVESQNNESSVLEKIEFKIPGVKESLKKVIGKVGIEYSRESKENTIVSGNIKIARGVFSQIGLKRKDPKKLEIELLQNTYKLKDLKREEISLSSVEVAREEKELTGIENKIIKLKKDIEEIKKKINQTLDNENKTRSSIWKLQEELDKTKNEILKITNKTITLTRERNELRKKYLRILKSRKQVRKKITILKEQLKTLQQSYENINNNALSLENERKSIIKSLNNLEINVKNIFKLKNKIKEEILKEKGVLRDKIKAQTAVTSRMKSIIEDIELMDKQKLELEKEIDKNTSVRNEDIVREISLLKEEIEKLENKHKEISSIVQEKEKVLQQVSLEIQMLELKLNESTASIGTFEEKVEVSDEIAALVNEEYKKMLEVNMLADTQYKEQSENYVLVVERLNKLEEEKKSIIDFINEIESKKKAAFLEALDSINEAFNKYFNLMVGGSAWLEIENKEEPFKGGVNIIVHFQNKYPRPVYGCSGGEKSVASLCFIFALQHLKPAPFYLFDEIDAHLDPVNVQNYAKLLQLRSKDSQYIVISLKDLVASKADKVVGVFMRNGKTRILDTQQILNKRRNQ
ncbi:MAG: AAA family ATPase [Thermoproteota archaeon]